MRVVASCIALSILISACGGSGGGGGGGTRLTSTSPGTQLVGEENTWTVIAPGIGPATYRFSVGLVDEALRIVYDFQDGATFDWAPTEEGEYSISVSIMDEMGDVTSVFATLTVLSHIADGPVVNATENPLLALYSAPPCADGANLRVHFWPAGIEDVTITDAHPCDGASSENIYLAGMRGLSTYRMQHQIQGLRGGVSWGPILEFDTGAIDVPMPTFSVLSPQTLGTSIIDDVVTFSFVGGSPENPRFPVATDLNGNVIWYISKLTTQPISSAHRFVGGGRLLMGVNSLPTEIDVAGNIIRQTNPARINDQLLAMGQDPIISIHHDFSRLPNGHTVGLGYTLRNIVDLQGPGSVPVIGDSIVVLDENFQVVWVWNSFEHMDLARLAILGETCSDGQGGCPNLPEGTDANDWLHSNAVTYSPEDGNFIMSIRHQDWVIKVNYADGAGDGAVIWRLGQGGDFSIVSPDPNPWFSHQHDSKYTAPGQITLFDNGNTRVIDTGIDFSRGQVYQLDEINMIANLNVNADLGNYSRALGSAQMLSNGNFSFNSGLQGLLPGAVSSTHEVNPDSTLDYAITVDAPASRSFRTPDLYSRPAGE